MRSHAPGGGSAFPTWARSAFAIRRSRGSTVTGLCDLIYHLRDPSPFGRRGASCSLPGVRLKFSTHAFSAHWPTGRSWWWTGDQSLAWTSGQSTAWSGERSFFILGRRRTRPVKREARPGRQAGLEAIDRLMILPVNVGRSTCFSRLPAPTRVDRRQQPFRWICLAGKRVGPGGQRCPTRPRPAAERDHGRFGPNLA